MRTTFVILAVGAATLTAACGGSSRPTTPAPAGKLEATLQRSLDELTATGLPGAVALVADGPRTLRLASGYADLAGRRPMRPADRFRVGSVTKTFVATVVLQLVGEGRLSLRDPVERWLPGLVPGGEHITVRELLNHTSGIYDYTRDTSPLDARRRERNWTPRTLVRLAASHPRTFRPGTGWAYSNTDYLLLGLIVEAASGRTIQAELEHRIFRPLELRDTSFELAPRIGGVFAHGYAPVDGLTRDLSVFSPSGAWAAGAIVSTADDLARFYRALLRGRLLSPQLLRAMKRTVAIPAAPRGNGSGLGIFETPTPCGPAWGHDGLFPGYRAVAWSSPDGARVVIVLVNDSWLSEDGATILHRLVTTAMCGR